MYAAMPRRRRHRGWARCGGREENNWGHRHRGPCPVPRGPFGVALAISTQPNSQTHKLTNQQWNQSPRKSPNSSNSNSWLTLIDIHPLHSFIDSLYRNVYTPHLLFNTFCAIPLQQSLKSLFLAHSILHFSNNITNDVTIKNLHCLFDSIESSIYHYYYYYILQLIIFKFTI